MGPEQERSQLAESVADLPIPWGHREVVRIAGFPFSIRYSVLLVLFLGNSLIYFQ